MDTPTRITVVLCTYNRAGTLAKALESVASQTLPPSVGWEILVVDNNSNDGTRQVVEGFRLRYPGRIRYLFEPRQGLSHARNAGVRDALGDILAFIDDDETAAVAWLHNLTMNLLDGGEWAGAGGRVLPQWSCPRPKWLSNNSSFAAAPLATFDPGGDGGELIEAPFGANMAFKRKEFESHGGFRVDLGRSGSSMLSSEDTEFGRRLMAAGRRLRYEPLALTYHPVEEVRVSKKYFLTWWFNKGRSDVRELGVQPSGTRVLGIRIRLFRDLLIEAVRWVIALEPSKRFICRLKVWAYAGEAFESYHQSIKSRHKGPESDLIPRPPAEGGE